MLSQDVIIILLLKKGKLRTFKLLKNNEEFQQAFLKFGDAQLFYDGNENSFNTVHQCICMRYIMWRG